ncbi:transcriptional regulator [Salmonella enterica subsp. enterica serovar Anatum]|uniref:Transcriptional regulator n=2 Tax=Salmonella enterica TaxID=28901 RepID=A0A5U0XKS6_SALER|nr:transcriptional regulator [Salmonella enterica subsp. enterica serovar Saintpaul]EAB1831044.1 transcriptional regulator [Salmonella enterica]EAC1927661.1 transcriptional regulator [Salmonella enterica subsp. enterica serovar Anatum]EAM7842511.1 transcriptional regulator [Salmonella enterica subsp. enterica]EAP3002748.1 transcriptional regulator [Salmonella enterica subsp. enterica serovar Johannesburg]EBE0761700.1 transcriptional regulator [Salmonella enterica subsp. enterica serovar Eko]E
MTIADITYGIPAEVWPRDYSNVKNSLMFWRKSLIPVRVTMEDGQVFCMYVHGLMSSRNKVDLCPAPFDKDNRVRLPLERVSTIESGVIEDIAYHFTGRITIHPDYVNNMPSRRDFFKICRQAHQERKSIRVYMTDGREIEGVSLGVDACQVTIGIDDCRRMIVLFDWVERILPF